MKIPFTKNNPEGIVEHNNYIICSCNQEILEQTGAHFLKCAYGVINRYQEKTPDPNNPKIKFLRTLNKKRDGFQASNMGNKRLFIFSKSCTTSIYQKPCEHQALK